MGKIPYSPQLLENETGIARESKKERKIIMKKEEIKKALEKEKARSAWKRGVVKYAMELIAKVNGKKITEKKLLNGADNWYQYSDDGRALIYNVDICHRLCTPSEIKKTKDGERRPNKHETWIDVQARALFQAAQLIMKIKEKS